MNPSWIVAIAALLGALTAWHLGRRADAPGPGRPLVAADRGTLDRTLAAQEEATPPLPPAVFRITTEGLRLES